ncbi:MAG: S-methyl-5'-thioadenosine phosphorylase [bacterium]|nr:S-methyl-5'-thioadenosine phosphorylase [bacterium]
MSKIGIIGGSGLYKLDNLKVLDDISLVTPFGAPSSVITRCEVRNEHFSTEVFFLARHGENHTILPGDVNYAANIWALKSLGVEWCISVSAVGSLSESMAPGDFVFPTQFIDRTVNRRSTFFGDGIAAHIAFGSPVCPVLHNILSQEAARLFADEDMSVYPAATYICMEGPAFSTRAESRLYQSWGADIIGMTNIPEAKLAREAEMAYATIAMVTDYDCWRTDSDDVDIEALIFVLKKNTEHARRLITRVIPLIAAAQPSELASKALSAAIMTPLSAVPEETLSRLQPILSRWRTAL